MPARYKEKVHSVRHQIVLIGVGYHFLIISELADPEAPPSLLQAMLPALFSLHLQYPNNLRRHSEILIHLVYDHTQLNCLY